MVLVASKEATSTSAASERALRTGVAGHRSLAHDHLAYCDLATDHHQRVYNIVYKHHVATVSRVERRNSALSDALRPVPKFAVGSRAWVYNTAATIRQGAKMDTEAKVFKAKLSFNWMGCYKSLAIGFSSSADTPEDSPVCPKLPYLDLLSDIPGAEGHRRVSVQRCKPCENPHDRGGMPKYWPTGLTQYVLNNFSKKSPRYRVTQDDVSTLVQRLEVEKITRHQSVRGRGGFIAVTYEMH